MKSTKIAFFNYLPIEYGGGLAQYFIQVSSELKNKYPDLDISIVTFNTILARFFQIIYSLYFFRKIDSKKKENIQTIKNNIGKVHYYKASSIKQLKIILKNQDVVYSKNDLLEVILLKFFIGYRNLHRVIIGFHTPILYEKSDLFHSKLHNIIYNSFIYKFLIKDAWKFHVINSFDEILLKGRMSDKITTKIYNPFELKNFKIIKSQFKLPFDKNNFLALWIGRLTKEKGIHELIKLITLSNKSSELQKISWVIIGSGEFENKIKKLSRIYTNVFYLGYIEHKYLASIYQHSNVFISTSHFETFPYVFLEAQSFGIPIIAFDIHGNAEIVHSGKNGYLVSEIAEFKSKIKQIMNKKKYKNNVVSSPITNKNIYRDLYNMFVKK